MRSFLKFLVVCFTLTFLAGCTTCRDSEPAVVEVEEVALAAVACDPCAGGACPVPQARAVAAPAVVGEYGYVLGPPGAREQFGSIVSVPPETLKCLADGAHRILVDALDTGRCVLTSLYPKPPEPSQRLVRIQRVPAAARVYRPRATGPCGTPVPPAPRPQDPNEPPPSIPAVRGQK